MNCCGKICLRLKKKKVADEPVKVKKEKLAIWNQMRFIASMSVYSKQQEFHPFDESYCFFVPNLVYLFDITESAMREIELDAFYSFYLSQALFERTRKSIISQRTHHFELKEIIKTYKMFEITSYSTIKDSTIYRRTKEFIQYLQFLPKCDSQSKSNYFSKPLTLHESCHLDKQERYFVSQDYGGFVSDWLQLMSWWRQINHKMLDSSTEIYRLLKAKKNQDHQYLNNEIIQSANELDALVTSLDLSHGSAELSAISQYIPLDKNIPDCRHFKLSYQFIFDTQKENIFYDICGDYRQIAFMRGCSYYNIHICFVILQLIVGRIDDKNLLESIALTLKPLIVEFYFDVICLLRIDVNCGDYIFCVTKKSLMNFQDLVLLLKRARDGNKFTDKPLNTTIKLWTQFLHRSIETTFQDEQILNLMDNTVTTMSITSIYKFILNIMKNGVLLVRKLFQKDFITERILLNLAKYDSQTHNTSLYEISCAQVACSLVSAYKIMHRENPYPEGCFWLKKSFSQREFKMFIDELRRTCGLQQLDTENMTIEFFHRTCEMQSVLNDELTFKLDNLTILAQKTNELLTKAKYIENPLFL
ncbi:uncharacterized protein TNIN_125331 [Trichonephila inaurata madagascariensis]|uniref:Uncharacterized protein n=1 Tax=Trichonephila inaurata madagascariensis TaxID=2747483 RepID=A0A8X7C4V7_9ARAC|nr:uncharacterized protein TNIN_125331 [Trichonephila inaurata madagascariensis]